jgi:hypothetical protein
MFGKIKEALSLERWIENFEGYLDARIELAKYDIREAMVGILVKAVFVAGMAFFGFLALVCLNFGLAFWMNTLLESSFAGFLLLGAFYLLLTLAIYLGKESPAMQEKAEAAFRKALDQPKLEEQAENQTEN